MEWTIAHYRIIAKIGEGGMGEVYQAEDTKLDRTVAIKLLPLALAQDQDRRRRFMLEAKAASALNHPNVCTIHEVGETNESRPYIVMEYVQGRTLDLRLQEQPFSIPALVRLAAQIADALDAAFERRIVHRDIKPSNISLSDRGVVKVLDFGLAKVLDQTTAVNLDAPTRADTHSGHVMGTPSYMSPEQTLGRGLDHRSDIFSLGVVLYELAGGQRPFVGASLGDTIDKILRTRPQPLIALRPDLPAEFERIAFKCLEKDPSRRYQTPRELMQDLQALGRALETDAPAGSERAERVEPAGRSLEDLRQSDIFISYAAVDDQPLAPDRAGWISQFHRDLAVRIEQLSGEPVKIWPHPNPAGTAQADHTVLELVPNIKAMVSVVSPPFARSEGCVRDVETFWTHRGRQTSPFASSPSGHADAARTDTGSRLFKVVKRPVPPTEWRPPLSEVFPRLLSYDFYEIEPGSGRLWEYDEAFGPLAKQRYYEKIYDLAREIGSVLRQSKNPQNTPATAMVLPSKTVFLAETTADLRQERDQLRRELVERGYQVLPGQSLPLTASELEAAIQADLARSDVAVHFIGSRCGFIPEGASESILEIQLRLSAKQSRPGVFPRLAWMPAGLQPQEPRQAEFINALKSADHAGQEIEWMVGNLNSLKDLLLKRLDPPPKTTEHPPATAAESGPPRVYLICDVQDASLVESLEDYLFDHGFEVSLPLFEGTSAEITEAHRRNLQSCDAALVFFGTTTNHWVEIKLMDLIQAPGYGRKLPFRAKAVFVAPSEDRRKQRFRTHIAEVLRPEPSQDASVLAKFVQLAKGVQP